MTVRGLQPLGRLDRGLGVLAHRLLGLLGAFLRRLELDPPGAPRAGRRGGGAARATRRARPRVVRTGRRRRARSAVAGESSWVSRPRCRSSRDASSSDAASKVARDRRTRAVGPLGRARRVFGEAMEQRAALPREVAQLVAVRAGIGLQRGELGTEVEQLTDLSGASARPGSPRPPRRWACATSSPRPPRRRGRRS